MPVEKGDQQPETPGIQDVPAKSTGRVTWRGVFVGLALAALVSVAAPYSDYIRDNTPMVGNHLPMVVIAVITLMCVAVNPVLGARRLTSGEMATAVAMMLIACAMPTSGLFRYFSPELAGTVQHAAPRESYRQYIDVLPDWLLPSKDPNSDIVRDYFLGVPAFSGRGVGGTWSAWAAPYLAWAFFLVPLFVCLLLICALMRKQWVERERLSFPLAVIPLEMMQDPPAGRRLNALWRSRGLWVAAAIPLVIHLLNGAHQFWPNVPEVSLRYDFQKTALADYPWNVFPLWIKKNELFLGIVGVTFLVPLEVTFSIWAFYLLYNISIVLLATRGVEVSAEHKTFHGLGFYVAYGVILLWVARHHLWHVAREAWRRSPREEGEPLSYFACVAGILLCAAAVVGFMAAAGVSLPFAVMALALMLMWSLIVTRIVIESGVLFVGTFDPLRLPGWLLSGMASGLETGAEKLQWMKNWVVTNFATRMVYGDMREHLMPFAANATRMNEAVERRDRRRHFGALLAALLVGLLASGATHHVLTHAYGRNSFDSGRYGFENFPQETLRSTNEYVAPGTVPSKIDRGANFAGAAGAMAVVGIVRSTMAVTYVHPIGLLLLNTYAGDRIWFSVMIGCALKFVVLRWGGSGIYARVRPICIGLLVGDCLAGVFWGGVGFLVSWPNPMAPYQVMPG